MPSQTTQKKSQTRGTKQPKHVERTLEREAPAKQSRTGGGSSRKTSEESERGVHQYRTAKVVELVCSSTKGFEDAIKNGVADASRTLHDIHGCEVKNLNVTVKDGKIAAYKVDLKLAFAVEGTPRP